MGKRFQRHSTPELNVLILGVAEGVLFRPVELVACQANQPWLSYQCALLVLCLRMGVAQMKTFTLCGSHRKSRKGSLLFIPLTDTDGKWEYSRAAASYLSSYLLLGSPVEGQAPIVLDGAQAGNKDDSLFSRTLQLNNKGPNARFCLSPCSGKILIHFHVLV